MPLERFIPATAAQVQQSRNALVLQLHPEKNPDTTVAGLPRWIDLGSMAMHLKAGLHFTLLRHPNQTSPTHKVRLQLFLLSSGASLGGLDPAGWKCDEDGEIKNGEPMMILSPTSSTPSPSKQRMS